MRKTGAFVGIASSNGVESKATQVAAYCLFVSVHLAMNESVSMVYLIKA